MQQSNSFIFLPGPEKLGTGKADAFVATGNANLSKLTRPKSVYKLLLLLLTGWLLMGINSQQAYAQPKIGVTYHQGLNFGEFYPGASGGTVKVNFSGIRSATGDVVLTGGAFNAAYFVLELNPKRVVVVTYSTPVTLTRPGGGSLQLAIAPGDLSVNPIVSTPGGSDLYPLYIGGTLTVGNILANPPGNYAGEFYVYFNYQ